MPRKRTRAELEQLTEKVWEMRLLDLNIHVIAKQLGISPDTVCDCMNRKLRVQTKQLKDRDKRFVEIWLNLAAIVKEAWRKYKTTSGERWLEIAIKAQDRQLLMLGVSKTSVNIGLMQNVQQNYAIKWAESDRTLCTASETSVVSPEPSKNKINASRNKIG